VKLTWSSIVPAAVALTLLFRAPLANAQAPAAKGQAPTAKTEKVRRLANGKPDLSGVWDKPVVFDMSKDNEGCSVTHSPDCIGVGAKELNSLLTPFAIAEDKKPKFEYTRFCLPWGYTRSWNGVYPAQLNQTTSYLVILFEQDNWFHVVPTDGRGHKPDELPTWYGNSVGKWDGDALVIDTTGYNGKVWLDTDGQHITTESLHTVERLTRPDFQHLNFEITVEDPKLYTKPWKNTRVFKLMPPGQEIMEYSCQENNKLSNYGGNREITHDESAGKPFPPIK
jgi:hypothetical protein